jgi:hypothetical protein
MDQIDQTSPALYTSLSPTVTETTFHASPTTPIKNEDGSTSEPQKKKQKRNKPTLSCEECVERKTKVSASFYKSSNKFSSELLSSDEGSIPILERP